MCVFPMDPRFVHVVRAEDDAVGRNVVTVTVNNLRPDIILAVLQQMRPKVPVQQMSNFPQGSFFAFRLSASK